MSSHRTPSPPSLVLPSSPPLQADAVTGSPLYVHADDLLSIPLGDPSLSSPLTDIDSTGLSAARTSTVSLLPIDADDAPLFFGSSSFRSPIVDGVTELLNDASSAAAAATPPAAMHSPDLTESNATTPVSNTTNHAAPINPYVNRDRSPFPTPQENNSATANDQKQNPNQASASPHASPAHLHLDPEPLPALFDGITFSISALAAASVADALAAGFPPSPDHSHDNYKNKRKAESLLSDREDSKLASTADNTSDESGRRKKKRRINRTSEIKKPRKKSAVNSTAAILTAVAGVTVDVAAAAAPAPTVETTTAPAPTIETATAAATHHVAALSIRIPESPPSINPIPDHLYAQIEAATARAALAASRADNNNPPPAATTSLRS